MSGLNNKRYLDGDGLLKFWEICCANFPHKDGRGATGNWNIKAATAGIADEAIKLKAARNITITGAVTGKADFDGSKDITISTGVNHTHNTLFSSTTDASNLSETPHAMRFDSCIADTNIDWATGYNNAILTIGRYKNAKYASQLGFSGNGMFHRYFNNKDIDNSTPWYKILDSSNYSTYALPLSGGTLTGNLTAPTFIGVLYGNVKGNVKGNVSGSSSSCTGNAATASNATKSESLAGGHDVSNAANYSITYLAGGFTNNTTPTANQVYLGTSPEWNVISSPRYDGTDAVQNIMSLRLGWNSSYWHEIATGPNVNNSLYHRSINYKNAKDWALLLDSSNYSTYALPLSGGTLTGNLTAPKFIGALQGNATTASSAAKLTTACKIWGQNFNGESDVTGDLTGVGSITMSGSIAYTTQVIGIKPTGASYASWRIVPYNGSLLIQASGDNGTTKTGKINLEGYEGGKLSQLYVSATNATFSDNVNATKFIGALQGNADSATKVATLITSAAEHYPLLFGSSAAADAAMTNSLSSIYKNSTNKVYFIPSEGRLVAPKMSATSFVGNLTGNVTGNATSADKLNTNAGSATKPIYFGEGIPKQCNDTLEVNITGNAKTATSAGKAGRTEETLTLKTPTETKTFNGAYDVEFEVTPAKLGLTKAVLYLGKSITAITDGGTEKPTIVIDGVNTEITTLSPGNIVIDSSDSREYIWNGSNWEKFGLDGDGAAGNYKPIQAVVGDPTASGNSTTFIDTIAQDANGKITATKKSVNFSGYKPTQTVVNNPTASGNEISFIDTLSQNTNGVITATRKTVRSATTSQSGVVTTGEQTFAGTKTFNGGIVGNLTGNVTGNVTGTASGNLPLSGGSLSGYLSSSDYILGTGLIRVNAADKNSNFGYIKAETYDSNRSVVHIGSNYGGSSNISNSVSYDAIGIYRTCVGIGGTFTGATLKANYDAGIKLDVAGNVKATKFIGDVSGNATTATTAASANALGSYTIDSFMTFGNHTNYVGARFQNSDLAQLAVDKYIEFWSTPGWFNSQWGKVTAHGGFTGDLTGNAATATAMSSFTAASTGDATKRYVWMSWNDNSGKPAYSDKLTFQTSTNTLFVNDKAVSLSGHTHSYLPLSGGTLTSAGVTTLNLRDTARNESGISYAGNGGAQWFVGKGVGMTNGAEHFGFYNGTKGLVANLDINGIFYATNFITSSDRRMKDNITEIVDASKSLELGFYEFDYKSGGHSAGHIAQEVREVLPEFVHGKETENEHLSVDYTGLHSVQIKALKDEVDTLKTENKELRERLEKLEALLEKLM